MNRLGSKNKLQNRSSQCPSRDLLCLTNPVLTDQWTDHVACICWHLTALKSGVMCLHDMEQFINRLKKLASSEYLQDLLVDFSGSDKYLLSFITLPECVVLFFQWFLQTMFHYERQCWTLGYTWNAHMAWASDMDHKLCCHEKQCHE